MKAGVLVVMIAVMSLVYPVQNINVRTKKSVRIVTVQNVRIAEQVAIANYEKMINNIIDEQGRFDRLEIKVNYPAGQKDRITYTYLFKRDHLRNKHKEPMGLEKEVCLFYDLKHCTECNNCDDYMPKHELIGVNPHTRPTWNPEEGE